MDEHESRSILLNENSDNKISVYPNPATDELHIKLGAVSAEQNEQTMILLKDMNAKIIWSNENFADTSGVDVDIKSLTAGIYFCKY